MKRPDVMRSPTSERGARRASRLGSDDVTALLPNAPRLSCAARAGGRTEMTCGAQQYVGAQMEFCQGRAAQLQPLVRRTRPRVLGQVNRLCSVEPVPATVGASLEDESV